MELKVEQDQGRFVNVGVNRLHISSYYHPASTQRLLEAITIVIILDQELLRDLHKHLVKHSILMHHSVLKSCDMLNKKTWGVKVWGQSEATLQTGRRDQKV